jgi:Fe-S oxidoreductase
MTMNDEMALLRATGARVELLDSGCCGMAGPFGFEKRQVRRLADPRRTRVCCPPSAPPLDDLLVSNGFSCREQIARTPRAAPFTSPKCSPATAETLRVN